MTRLPGELRVQVGESAKPGTVSDALAEARRRLPGDTADFDAQVLLASTLGRNRAWLLAHGDEPLGDAPRARFESAVARVAAGEPLPYVLGHWEFFGLDFEVTPHVLIPRPETELLVERALAWMPAGAPARRALRVADVGTGSGCIVVALSFHSPAAEVHAVDLSAAALDVARRNAARHGVEGRIRFAIGDLLEPVPGPIDVLCANLPYIASDSLRRLPVSRAEPTLALDGGADGLHWIRRLLGQAPPKMARPGLVALEIEASQGPAAIELARAAFPRAVVALHRDLAGLDRIVEIRHD